MNPNMFLLDRDSELIDDESYELKPGPEIKQFLEPLPQSSYSVTANLMWFVIIFNEDDDALAFKLAFSEHLHFQPSKTQK